MARRPYSHASVEAWDQAARNAHLPIGMTSYSDLRRFPWYARIPVRMRYFLDPVLLAFDIIVRHGKLQRVVIREFHTLPFLLALPVLWSMRSRITLVIHTNLQRAHQKLIHRLGLRLLFRAGFRFAFLESSDGLREIGINPRPGQVLVLPLGYPDDLPLPKPPQGPLTVGIVGSGRKEKRYSLAAETLEKLMKKGDLGRVIVGTDDPSTLIDARSRGFEVLDTHRREAYGRALRACHVIFLMYDPTAYYYRSSAAIHDAVGAGRAVVCPDYPVFRSQIKTPCSVGEVFSSVEEIPGAIRRAHAITIGQREHFQIARRHRGLERIARLLREHLEGEATFPLAGETIETAPTA